MINRTAVGAPRSARAPVRMSASALGSGSPVSRSAGTKAGPDTQLDGTGAVALDAFGNLYVVNAPINTRERFGPFDSKPAATIAGPDTQLDGPQSLTLDAAGDVVTADEYFSAITAYAPTDNGDLGPSYSISGPATGLNFPVGLDTDATGNLYVSNFFGNSITVYGAGARDNAAPLRTLSGSATGLAAPEHLAVTPPLTILTRRLPAARANRPFRSRLIAAFGIGRDHWTVASGRVPRGLRLNARTGWLVGILRRAGTFHFRVKVTDQSHPTDTVIRHVTLIVHTTTPRTGTHRHRGDP